MGKSNKIPTTAAVTTVAAPSRRQRHGASWVASVAKRWARAWRAWRWLDTIRQAATTTSWTIDSAAAPRRSSNWLVRNQTSVSMVP